MDAFLLLFTILTTTGQSVEAGQQLCCVEAMKMVNVLRANKAGKVGGGYESTPSPRTFALALVLALELLL